MERFVYNSPVGPLTLYGEDEILLSISFENDGTTAHLPIFDRVILELSQYFAGERKQFDIPLLPAPTPFTQAVREGMLSIGYGEVLPYGLLAEAIGHPRAGRAVGNACHNNQYPILVPCHRVVAAHGLGGFAGKDEIKQYLIQLEQKNV